MQKTIPEFIIRDISWLSFNARVLQEAKDKNVSLKQRLNFLGIFSNNLDEFFRVRVATLNRMSKFGKSLKMYLENHPDLILEQIKKIVLTQQKDFELCYQDILTDLRKEKIALVNEKELNVEQKKFVETYFNEKVRTNIQPLMIESIPELPLLQDKSIYLACVLTNSENSFMNSYALIEIPTSVLPRFLILPSSKGFKNIILLEDVIRYCLPKLFTQFGFNNFEGYIIKVTRDAELDIDNDVKTDIITRIEKGLKNRKKGKAVRLVYDKTIKKSLLNYLIKLLGLSKKEHLVPGGRIHNYKDFINFPKEIFDKKTSRNDSFVHPLFTQPVRILDVLNKKDVMLHFPYHSFDSIIDLLREAAIDPFVQTIKITSYRLAKDSKIANALINAVRNGKKVTVVIELRARFDEQANLNWKKILEEEGVKVIVGLPDMKIHAKICSISKIVSGRVQYFSFISTGNLNENTAKFYGDHCLLTSNKIICADVNKVFLFIENQNKAALLKSCKALITSPFNTRDFFIDKIEQEISSKNKKQHGAFIIKLNSLVDDKLIKKIYEAKKNNVDVKLIIRGICCAITENKKWKTNIQAISIVDEYLEHARVMYFKNNDKEDVYISSSDWMIRNLDYRIEVSTPIFSDDIKKELKQILDIQLAENVKARILNNRQNNNYVLPAENEKRVRSQEEIYFYLKNKNDY